jgi:ABC-type multidrug transport system ATPase subunit
VCPQFDLLWSELTVEEHLLFYARLKGIKEKDEVQMVKKALEEVHLTEKKDMLTKFLPLGMKRRLSIAISLVAKPKVVFLDEPTTGLDPETRRQLWNILQDCRSDKKRAIVLTTHSMEEADVLCNRIGIVNNGILRCIGS